MLDRYARKQEQTDLAHKLGKAIEATVVWDSVYYVRIAQCGYEYEQTYAFLPLLPLSMLFLSKTVLAPLIPVLGQRAVLALSGYILNNIAFVFAGLFLYKLTLLVLKDPKLALRTVALFCFNPASIFYSSIYSESLFSLLSFAGIYFLLSGMNWKATLLFAMSSAVRSNGVINAGFILFQAMHQAYEAFFRQKLVLLALQVLFVACLRSVCVFAPFLFFQLYGFLNICHGESSSQGSRPWCTANVPYLYGFVQSHYWEVGFLRYFQLKQLPNFLLASPMLLLGACSVIEYAVKNSWLLFSLGFKASYAERETASIFYFVQRRKKLNEIAMRTEEFPNSAFTLSSASENVHIRKGAKMNKHTNIQAVTGVEHSNENFSSSQMEKGLFSCLTVPFILQLAFMIFIACFVMHVQVATRFLSVSPPIYWFASYFMESSQIGFKLGYIVWTVFLSYLFVGCLLFPNFYPFT
ncbi:hypothetical protein SUGI_0412820 [Cryptomeria japonica]|nr:hypothetical protein SUGI_0412820 [Cryptomeria japonica]